ncbi:MAG TPA: hypothetical protein VH170_06730 [Chthoniobacterales bacterium]|nr:hypothetical protein [Chthoniobacterales bacterium]
MREKSGNSEIALVTARLRDNRPDFIDIHSLEEGCLQSTSWQRKPGAVLFHPVKISSRLYTLFHTLLRPFVSRIRINDVVVSIGLPYRHYFFGKTFPYFTFGSKLRVLWTWDAWEPKLEKIAALAREARIDILLVSSLQSSELLRAKLQQVCEVHWLPEAVDVSEYRAKAWNDREIDVLSFGRSLPRYKDAIRGAKGLNCVLDKKFPTKEEFISALADSKISICFPKAVTDPDIAGRISTVTLRYLQSMAAKCLILGEAPAETQEMFGYDPIVPVDWRDPVGQLLHITSHPEEFASLIEKNFAEVTRNHKVSNFAARIDEHIQRKIQSSLV